jgi:diguanylate cyclase (GGDEF)-like protein
VQAPTGIETWSDASKVALVSGLTVPFALLWLLRILQIQGAPELSTYVSRPFLPVLVPFLVFQLAGHTLLLVIALTLRRRLPGRAPALALAEIQLWCGCLAFSLYAVGMFTHPYAVLLTLVPFLGYLLFDERLVHSGLVTLSVGVAIGILLPVLGITPYAPFLDHAPFAHGVLEPMWLVTTGLPVLFACGVGLYIHVGLVRRLRARQRELEWRSSVDPLTGVWNRSVFFARLEEEVARARRHQMPLTVLMIDVDHFKRVNDTHGHATGDRVLAELATKISDSLRVGDVAARYGGEELSVLLPHTALDAAAIVAQRVVSVSRTVTIVGGENATVSVGVAQFDGQETADALVARSDAALYAAKREGRDRVAKADAPQPAAGAAPSG